MNSEEKSNFINKLRIGITEGEDKLEFFIEKWKEFNDIDKESLSMPLLEMCIKEMRSDNYKSKAYFEFQNIVLHIKENQEYKSDIKMFNLSNAVKANEIVKIFLELKKRKYIDNTNEDNGEDEYIIGNMDYEDFYELKEKQDKIKKENIIEDSDYYFQLLNLYMKYYNENYTVDAVALKIDNVLLKKIIE